jgi:flagellar hook-associated protein 3 FlgL
MELRSTSGIRVAQTAANMQSQAASVAKWQQAIASGRRLEKPSDGPSDFVAMIDYKARSVRIDTLKTAINDSTTTLNEGVSHLTEAHDVLTKAFTLAADGANAATDDRAYPAIAAEVDALLTRMIEIGNAQPGGRFLFGGTKTATKPFTVATTNLNGQPETIVYNGSDERSKGIIGSGQTVDTTYAGGRVFQDPSADVFQSLIALRNDLQDTSLNQTAKAQALNVRMAEIDKARNRLTATMGEQASSLENLEALNNRLGDVKVNVEGRLGDISGTDFAEAAIKFQEQQNAFQATLAMSAKIFDASLLDFIR